MCLRFIETRGACIEGRIQMFILLLPDITASLTRVKWCVALYYSNRKEKKTILSSVESFPIPHGSHGTVPPWKLVFFRSRLYGTIPRVPANCVLRNGANGHVLTLCLSVHTNTLPRQFCHRWRRCKHERLSTSGLALTTLHCELLIAKQNKSDGLWAESFEWRDVNLLVFF